MEAVTLLATGVLLAAGALTILGVLLLREMRRQHEQQSMLQLLATLGPAVAAARSDPEALVAWMAVAGATRRAFPQASARLDAAAGGRFPFSSELVDTAHARWTTDWLAWERRHDLEYKQRTAAAEQALDAATGDEAAACRLRLAAVNQEKLQTYQQRYEHYVRIGKALRVSGDDDDAPSGGTQRAAD